MRGDSKSKGKPDLDHAAAAAAAAQNRGRKPPTEAAPIDDVMLREYLLDALVPEVSARVEKALRDSAELRARSRMSDRTARTGNCIPWGQSGTDHG